MHVCIGARPISISRSLDSVHASHIKSIGDLGSWLGEQLMEVVSRHLFFLYYVFLLNLILYKPMIHISVVHLTIMLLYP